MQPLQVSPVYIRNTQTILISPTLLPSPLDYTDKVDLTGFASYRMDLRLLALTMACLKRYATISTMVVHLCTGLWIYGRIRI